MRKFLLFSLLICMALFVWGQEEKSRPAGSAGIGIIFNNDFAGYIETVTAASSFLPANTFGIGIYAYGDFVYAEVSCGMFFGNSGGALNFLGANMELYGKYPFLISQKISLFPLLGFEFQAALFAKYNKIPFEDNFIDWKQFWFKAGAGLDYKITERIHLRFEALYGVRIKTPGGNDLIDGTQIILNDNIGHGFTFKVAIGV